MLDATLLPQVDTPAPLSTPLGKTPRQILLHFKTFPENGGFVKAKTAALSDWLVSITLLGHESEDSMSTLAGRRGMRPKMMMPFDAQPPQRKCVCVCACVYEQ